MMDAVRGMEPDVIASEDVARFKSARLRELFPKSKLVAFCSHRADDSDLGGWDCVFSSFRWMPFHCQNIGPSGVRCEYLPLAFGRPVLRRLGEDPIPRDIPVAFIGGLGNRIWDAGTKTMAAIAEAIPSFEWRGYWAGDERDIPPALQRARKPAVYGLDYYRLLHRTQIVVNRHGEIAKGQAMQNMREFEAPGCGCFLLSDTTPVDVGVINYPSAERAIEVIQNLSDRWEDIIKKCASERQQKILKEHCYENRAVPFMKAIESL
jgi:hypothetical protein